MISNQNWQGEMISGQNFDCGIIINKSIKLNYKIELPMTSNNLINFLNIITFVIAWVIISNPTFSTQESWVFQLVLWFTQNKWDVTFCVILDTIVSEYK